MHAALATGMKMIRQASGVTIQITRGSASSPQFTAGVGRTRFDVETSEGYSIRHRQRDYLIAIADYVLDNVASEPQTGDVITEGTKTYQVLPISADGKPFEFSDTFHQQYRVHTKELT